MALRRMLSGNDSWSGDARSWTEYQPDERWELRDHNRSQGYFVNLIAVEAESRARLSGLVGPGKHATRRSPQVQVHVWKSELRSFFARYSLGEPIELLAPAYSSLVRGRAALLTHGFDKPVEEAIQLCALATLFGDVEAATVLGFLRQRDGLDDMIADLCLARLAPSSNRSRTLQLPEWHEGLVTVAEHAVGGRPGAARDRLVEYVEDEWYDVHGGDRRAWWFDTHIAGTDYVGYWAWEAAAIARVFDVDDSDLSGHPHYPGDIRTSS